MLLARCRRGDEAAFATLVSRYRKRLINLAYQLLQDQAEAEDVAQEVFIKLFTSLPTFRGDATLFTYLYRITLNLCHSRQRRKGWELETSADLDGTEKVEGDFCEQVVTKLLVEHVLAELPPEQRTVLLLREWHDLSYDEIARITGARLGTVKSRLNAARRAFQERWEAEIGELRGTKGN